MIRTILFPTINYEAVTFELSDEQNKQIENLTDYDKAVLLFNNLSLEEQKKTSISLICEHFSAGLFELEPQKGICRICGCTEHDACTHPVYGSCWWVDEKETLCSHCASDKIKNDFATKGPSKIRKITSIMTTIEITDIEYLRLQIGEIFIKWADEYYSDQSRIGKRIARRQLYNEYLNYSPEQRKYCSPTVFKKKFINYCALKGYVFNPGRYEPVFGLPLFFDRYGKPDLDDKSSDLEYFTIAKKK